MAEKVEVDLIVKAISEGFDTISKDLDKAAGSSKNLATDLGVTEESARKLVKQFEQLGVNTDEMSDEFLELNPKVKKSIELLEELAKVGEKVGKSTTEITKGQREASKGSDDLKKKLTGLAKGFLGITGAIVAGRAIAKFGKDSLAAAKAAGRLPPIFTAISETSAKLKEEFGVALARNLKPVLGLVEGLGSLWADDLQIVNAYNKAVADGVITQEQFNDALGRAPGGEVDVFGGVGQKRERLSDDEKRAFLAEKQAKFIKTQNFQLELQNRAEKSVLGATVDIQVAYAANRDLLALTNEDLAEMADRQLAINKFAELGMAAAAQRTGLRQIAPLDQLGGADVGIAGKIQQELDKIDFVQAGGELAQDLFGRLQEQFQAGQISLDSYERSLELIAVRALAVEAAVGNISINEAARQIAKDMNISFQEALDLLNGINTQLDNIDGKKATAVINIVVKGGVAGEVAAFGGGGGILENFTPNARGGNFSAGQGLLVGEEGPELIVPRGSGTVIPNNQIGSSGSGGGADMSVLEGKFDRLSSDMKNMVLEMTQVIAERG